MISKGGRIKVQITLVFWGYIIDGHQGYREGHCFYVSGLLCGGLWSRPDSAFHRHCRKIYPSGHKDLDDLFDRIAGFGREIQVFCVHAMVENC